MDLQKKYMKDHYSKYWLNAREKIYGFLDYDQNLCRYLEERIPSGARLLDVCVGTGYPFAQYFQQHNYQVFGVDLASDLIEKCHRAYPEIHCQVADAEVMPYQDHVFDGAYCFHSSWYFPNLFDALDEMIRVTKSGGVVMFDVMNKNNDFIDHKQKQFLFQTRGVGKAYRYMKNIGKIVFQKGAPVWDDIIPETPTDVRDVYYYLKEKNITDYNVMVKDNDSNLKHVAPADSLKDYSRVCFDFKKPL